MGECDKEMMLDHEGRITQAQSDATDAHKRITELVALIKDFTVEMRASNKNISEVVFEIKNLTKEITHIGKTMEKHEDDITEIKDNMETKDTVLKLYDKIEAAHTEHKKDMDTIMAQMRSQEKAFEEHKLEPMVETYKAINSLKKWLIAGVGAIIISVVTAVITFIILK